MTLPWFRRAATNTLPPRVVGGVPRGPFRCPEPTCDLVDMDPEVVLAHAFAEHDRRRGERRVAG